MSTNGETRQASASRALRRDARLVGARWLLAGLIGLVSMSPVSAETLPPVNWTSAGHGTSLPKLALPEEKSPLPGSGFDCATVTRSTTDLDLGMPGDPDHRPEKAQRCSRDGLSLEIGTPTR